MDTFELSTDTYDASDLCRSSRRTPVQPEDDERLPLDDIDELISNPPKQEEEPVAETVKPPKRTTQRKTGTTQRTAKNTKRAEPGNASPEPDATAATPTANGHATAHTVELPHISVMPTIRQFFSDGRFSIFCGVVLILVAAYMLLASISYIANAATDQSLLVNTSTETLKTHSSSVNNSAGWIGAMLSHFIIYRWLGVGAFVIIFYVGALGFTLVKLCKFNFWTLTFKSLVSALALSLIVGLVTYNAASPTFWGGEHGYFINKALIDNASPWSAIALSVIMLTALILIFIKPVSFVVSALIKGVGSMKMSLARRHDAAMEAAHRTEMRYQAEKEAEKKRAERRQAMEEAQQKAAAESKPAMSMDEELSAPLISPKPKPASLDEMYAPVAPTVTINDLTDDFHSAPASEDNIENETVVAPRKEEKVIEDKELADIPSVSLSAEPEAESDSFDAPTAEPEHEPAKLTTPLGLSLSSPAEVSQSISLDSEAVAEPESEAPIAAAESAPEEEKKTEVPFRSEAAPMAIELKPIEPAKEIDDNTYDPTAELAHYKFPPIDLLRDIKVSENPIDEEEQEANKERITNILRSYGVEIASITATIGPTITLYEIVPAPGVRIAKIKRLGDDVALNLSAMGIRIIAPIPGKGTIGMEVPNKNPQVVSMKSILTSRAYRESKAQLPMAMGTTISNDVYVADLAKMPHLLVAGATGMGKSVGLNTIIASLLYRKHPAELKFVLVDPKMVEFSLYKCIERHYLAKLPDEDEKAIITDPLKVVATLNSLCIEMDNRYALLSEAGMRGIKEYNEKFISRRLNPNKGHRFLPYIVVVIDEFADLILTAGKEVETPISRIAAKARAVGIHMILATQRPSVNVITGVIKANFPGRMAFRVTQRNDSQTILDRPGAEQLIGRGDMLISRDGIIDRVQCAFIDTPEVEAICKFISEQQAYPSAYELPEVITASESSGAAAGSLTDRDPLFADAGREVIGQGLGSASSLQRKFNIGYPRAGKIMDQLEMAGVVGPTQGGKPRAVLMDMYSFERLLESN